MGWGVEAEAVAMVVRMFSFFPLFWVYSFRSRVEASLWFKHGIRTSSKSVYYVENMGKVKRH